MPKEFLPQGSAISPLLFVIFINDIGFNLRTDTIARLFADGTTIARQGSKQDDLKQLMQEEVDKIMEWADTWKMVINKDKTKAMVISSDTKDTSWDIGLFAEDTQIETVKHYPFLGNKLDNGLYFGAHTEKMAVKCRKRNQVIKALAWKEWGNQLETKSLELVAPFLPC